MSLLRALHVTALRGQIKATDLQTFFKASVFYGTAITNVAKVEQTNPRHIEHLDTEAYLEATSDCSTAMIRNHKKDVVDKAYEAHKMLKPLEKPVRQLVSIHDVVNYAGHLLEFCRAKFNALGPDEQPEARAWVFMDMTKPWFWEYIESLRIWGEEMLPGRKEDV